jgi:hypothetical protein
MIKLVVLAIVTMLGLISHSCSQDHDKTHNTDVISIKWNGFSNIFNYTNSDVSVYSPITFTGN